MAHRLSISVVLFVLGCSTKPMPSSEKSSSDIQYFSKRFNDDQLVRFYNYSEGIDLPSRVENDSAKIADLFFENYIRPYGKKREVIRNVTFVSQQSIFSLGETAIFSIVLSEELPSTWPIRSLLVLSHHHKKMFLLNMQSFEPVKLKEKSAPLLAGRRVNRGVGDFAVFKFSNDSIFSVFESDMVSSYLEECKRIRDHNMKLDNSDLNGDGVLDLRFTGTMYYYCEGQSSEPRSVPIDSARLNYNYPAEIDSRGIVQWRRQP